MPDSPLIDALSNPDCYPHPVTQLRRLETHISWIWLSGEYAYKIKKPVNLGFLDFSTLEKRHACCEEELRLNRRLAAELYLDVVSINGTPAQPRISGEGPVLEYAVRMRQFADSARLDRQLAAGRLDEADMDALAQTLAAFHGRAESADPADRFGEPDSVRQPVMENLSQLHRLLREADDIALVTQLETQEAAQFARLRARLAARRAAGQIRECHGDLHLANLVRLDSGITAFDCLEFNPALRWIDVISEVAFLLMDLSQRGQAPLGWRFLNRWLEYTGDYDGLALLGYYLSYRATVRAKVEAISMNQTADMAEYPAHLQACRRYLYSALHPPLTAGPALLITHGLSGSGKSRLGRFLMQSLPAVRIRSDVERKRLAGLRPEDASQSAPGSGLYTDSRTAQTYQHLLGLAEMLLAQGHSVIVDATFLQRAQRQPFIALASQLALPFVILHCTAPEDVLRERVQRRRRGAQVSEAGILVLEKQLAEREAPNNEELASVLTVDTTDEHAHEHCLATLRTRLPSSDRDGL